MHLDDIKKMSRRHLWWPEKFWIFTDSIQVEILECTEPAEEEEEEEAVVAAAVGATEEQ